LHFPPRTSGTAPERIGPDESNRLTNCPRFRRENVLWHTAHDSVLNALLRRWKKSARTERYNKALAKVGDDPRAADLH